MIKYGWITLFGLVGGCAVAGPQVQVTRSVAGFDGIVIEGAANVEFKQGANYSVVVKGEKDEVDKTLTSLKDGSLVISQKPGANIRHSVKVIVSGPKLKLLKTEGAGNIDATGLNVKTLSVQLNGAGNISLKGSTDSFVLRLGGAGNVRANNLKAKDADINLTGSGNVDVFSSNTLKMNLDGAGNIRYFGSPASITKKAGGVGRISQGT